MSRLSQWIYDKTNRHPCALPEHLRNWKGTNRVRLHNDWPPILNMIPRSANSCGPRCPKGTSGYAPWPPRLIEGKGITRWENAGASSILWIPHLEDKTIDGSFYGTKVKAFETNPGNQNYRREGWVFITWKENDLSPQMYSPSALQRWSDHGYLKMDPEYYSWWKIIKKNEDPFKTTLLTKENTVLFFRWRFRPDHQDIYYNDGPMIGLHMD